MLNRFGFVNKLGFGQDPKLTFRSSRTTGLPLLRSATPIPLDTQKEYWNQYLDLFDSLSDVITLIDAETLTQSSRVNFKRLIQFVSESLFDALASHDHPVNTKRVLNAIRVLSRVVPCLSKIDQRDGRVEGEFEREVFWKVKKVRVRNPNAQKKRNDSPANPNQREDQSEASQFVLEDEDDQNTSPTRPDDRTSNPGPDEEQDEWDWQEIPPLAERLLAALVDLSFVPGFTISEECRDDSGRPVAYVIWEAGIANPSSVPFPPTSPQLLSARLEVMRLLNILLALPSLVTPPHLFPLLPNRWREAFVSSSLERKVVLCFLCSIINTALDGNDYVASIAFNTQISDRNRSSSTTSSIDGSRRSVPASPEKRGAASSLFGAATGAAGKLGGAVLRLGTEDPKGLLVTACLQLLTILLAQHHSVPLQPSNTTAPPSPERSRATVQPSKAPSTSIEINSFAYYVSKLHRTSDFELIARGVLAILDQATNEWPTSLLPRSVSGVLSGSSSISSATSSTTNGAMSNVTSSLVVLWRMGELNPKLWKWLTDERDDLGGGLILYLMTFCLEFKDDEAQIGLVRLSAFMLQSISAQAGLADRWNMPLEMKLSLRSKYGVPGTFADFLIVSIYTLVFTTKGRLAPLYPTFLLTISNASSHFKSLSQVASTRLLQLFLAFSAPNFLLMEEGNPRLVYYLLETFNNIVHYQLSDNPELVYALLRSHQRFDELSHFTLSFGVNEARRIKAERRVKKSGGEKGKQNGNEETTNPTDEDASGLSEKARGKRREGDEAASLASISVADLSLAPPPEPTTPSLFGRTTSTTDEDETTGTMGEDESAPFVGKNGFIPTEGWVASWREGLPLDSILIAISELKPMILDLPIRPNPNSTTRATQTTAISILSSASLSGLLPSTRNPAEGGPKTRPFRFNSDSIIWLGSLIYGSIYLSCFELVREVPVCLFGVASSSSSSSRNRTMGGSMGAVLGGAVERVVGRVGGGGGGVGARNQ